MSGGCMQAFAVLYNTASEGACLPSVILGAPPPVHLKRFAHVKIARDKGRLKAANL